MALRKRTLIFSLLAVAATPFAHEGAAAQPLREDGVGDFDWEIGAWDTVVRVRAPLSEEAVWTEFRGASIVHAFSDGRANLVDLDVANGERRVEGVSLRLYNPQTRQWNINFASMRNGALTAPVYGGFEDGRGVFYGQELLEGRAVLVRFVISDITSTSARFVQSYSADGGQAWTDNWVATDTRRRR